MGKHDKFKERNIASYKRELKGVETKQGKKEPLIALEILTEIKDKILKNGKKKNYWHWQ